MSPKADDKVTSPLPPFAASGLPIMFQESWRRAAGIDGNSIVKLSHEDAIRKASTLSGHVVRAKVTSQTRRNGHYYVEVSSDTGRATCSCYQFEKNRDPACKHIIATAWKNDKLEELIAMLSKEKSQRLFGQGSTLPTGGWKPCQGPKRKTGSGFTKRNGLSVDTPTELIPRVG